jgi:fibronectin-binding autotransporter adhesin
MENLQGMGAPTREIGGFRLKPCAMAFAVALALVFAGCGGGGGGGANVRPTQPNASGNVNVSSGDTLVWSNNITGSAGVIKGGGGTLILAGTDSYTGGTTINAGTLQIGNGGTTGSIIGDVTDNASLVFYRSDDVTFEGNISGSGSLKQAGMGTLILTGTNTYTGGTTISDGTLQIGQLGGLIGTVGSIVGDVTNNGSLVFARGDDLTFSGVIRGSGSLEQAGTGTLTLTGTHTYTGGTTVTLGTLQIGNGGTTGSIVGDVTNNTYYGSLTFNRSDDVSYGGVISGSGGVVKLGGGTLTISGVNTFTGGAFVKAGTLKIVPGGALNTGIFVGGANQNATLEIDKGATASVGVSLEQGGRLDNAGAVVSKISGSSAVRGGDSTTVVNHDGGLIESDFSQPGYDIPAIGLGLDSTLTNSMGSTIRGYTGVITGGAVSNAGGSIIGMTRDGIRGATVVNNSDGGSILAGFNANRPLNISSGINTDATNASINNIRGSTIKGVYRGITLFDGGTVTNDGGSLISGSTGISIISRSSATGTVNNAGGSTITGVQAGIVLSYGGTVANGPGSTIETTALASGDCSVTLACSIFVPVYRGVGSYGSNGTLHLTNAGSIIGDVQMDPTAVNDTTLIAGGSIQGDLNVGLNAQSSLTLDGNAGTAQSYSNAVTGTTTFGGILVKHGGGTWVIDNGDLQGVVDTSVNAGSLQAAQTLSGNVTVNASGNLDGVPGVAGNLSNAGKVAVHGGDSAVDGNYVQSSTGSLAVSLGSKLDVTGAATLNGGTLEITGADSGYVSNAHTNVLTASGGVNGTFDQLVKGTGVVFTATTINYDANSVWLDTTGLDVTTAAAGQGVSYTKASMGSAQRVQGAFELLDDKLATGRLAGVSEDFVHAAGQFQQSPTLQAAQASLQSLSGELHAASAAMTFRAIDASSRVLSDRFDNLLDKGTGFGMWMQNLNVGGDMARAGFDGIGFQLDGWLVGSDRRIGHSGVAGYAFGQSHGQQRLDRSFDHDNSRSTEGMMYAGWLNGDWYTQGRVGFGRFDQDVSRRILLGDSVQGVRTQYSGNYNVAYGESGLHLGRGDSHVTPFVHVQYARIDRGGFAEQGAGGFGLRSNAQTLDRWQAGLGVRVGRHWNLDGGRAVDFSARAQWQRTLASHGDVFDASFVGLQQWRPLAGIGLSRYSGLLGVGLDATLSTRTTLKFGYDYEMGQRDHAQMLSARLNVAF